MMPCSRKDAAIADDASQIAEHDTGGPPPAQTRLSYDYLTTKEDKEHLLIARHALFSLTEWIHTQPA
jgi:hypothetical protein